MIQMLAYTRRLSSIFSVELKGSALITATGNIEYCCSAGVTDEMLLPRVSCPIRQGTHSGNTTLSMHAQVRGTSQVSVGVLKRTCLLPCCRVRLGGTLLPKSKKRKAAWTHGVCTLPRRMRYKSSLLFPIRDGDICLDARAGTTRCGTARRCHGADTEQNVSSCHKRMLTT